MQPILTLLLIFCFFLLYASSTQLKLRKHQLQKDRRDALKLQKQRLAKGSADLYDYLDTIYVADIGVGTPPQHFQVALDGSNPFMWIIDDGCEDQECFGYPDPNFHNYEKHQFHRESSITFTDLEKPYQNDYGAGTLSADKFELGEIKVKNQTFGTATSVQGPIPYLPLDGILGFSIESYWGITSPVVNLFSQMENQIFTVYLERHTKPSEGQTGGQITLGALDPVNCDSKITYVPLLSDNSWAFNIDGFAIGKYATKRSAKANTNFADGYIVAPYNDYNAILHQTKAEYVPELDAYVLPCDSYLQQPNITFTIGGQKFVIPAIDYMLDLNLGKNQCALGVYDTIDREWLLAEVFMRAVCSVYDYKQLRMGFATAFHPDK